MTRLWRCVPSKYTDQAYQGLGGLHVDGRWHNAGRPIVYASTSPGTAVLEALVHEGDLQHMFTTHVLLGAHLPDDAVMDDDDLPPDWNAIPFPEATQLYGDTWLQGGTSVALRVPSAVVPDDNVLLNPLHADFKALAVDAEPIRWDPRLIA